MAPKRAGKADKDSGKSKKSRTSGGEGSRSKMSEGITERQLASFSDFSAEANALAAAARNSIGNSSSHTGFDSLLAAAGVQAQSSAAPPPNILGLGDQKVVLQLLQMQQQGSISLPQGIQPSHLLGAVPPSSIPMPSTAHDRSGAAVTLGSGPGLGIDEASANQLRVMLQSGAFSTYNVQALLQAQIAGASQPVLQMPQFGLQAGVGALPSIVTLDAKPPLTPHPDFTFAAINAVNIDAVQDPASSAARSDAKPEGNAGRSHGPSVDR